MGAVSLASRKYTVHDNKRVVEAEVTMSASYATNGDTVSAAALGLKQVDSIVLSTQKILGRGAVATANLDNGVTLRLGGTASAPTLIAYDAAGTEVAAATNLSAHVFVIRFYGS